MPKGMKGFQKGHKTAKPFQKGHKINLGKKWSQESREKLRKSRLGRKLSEDTKNKIRLANTGYKHTDEAKRNMSIARKGSIITEATRIKISNILKGRKLSEEHRNKISGEGASNWKGGKSYGYWKRKVLRRDNYICGICGLNDPEVMEADHIKPKSEYPELRFDISNGVTLCANCHRRKTNKEHKLRRKNQ